MTMQRDFVCGDCMNFIPDFPDNYFDVAVVDPPYGIKEHGGKNRSKYVKQKNGSSIYVPDGGYKSILNSCSEYQRIRLSGDVITLITQWQVA